MSRITPRWLTHLLQWVPVEAGIYRLNRVKDESKVTVEWSDRDERELPQTFVDYEEHPREYMLSAVNTVVDAHTRVSDLYSVPYNQITEQLRLTIEIIKERHESESSSTTANMVCSTQRGSGSTRERAPRLRTIWLSCWSKFGRSGLFPDASGGDRGFRS